MIKVKVREGVTWINPKLIAYTTLIITNGVRVVDIKLTNGELIKGVFDTIPEAENLIADIERQVNKMLGI